MQKTEIARRCFFVPCGDAAPPLDGMKEALDEVALFVEFLVIAPLCSSRFVRRYDGLDAPLLEFGDNPIGVVGLVGENGLTMRIIDEFFGDGGVMLLSRGDQYVDGSGFHINCNVNLRREAAS